MFFSESSKLINLHFAKNLPIEFSRRIESFIMSDPSSKWYVIKNGKQIGPFTTDELKSGLQRGQFDPLEQVQSETLTSILEIAQPEEFISQNAVSLTSENSEPSKAFQNENGYFEKTQIQPLISATIKKTAQTPVINQSFKTTIPLTSAFNSDEVNAPKVKINSNRKYYIYYKDKKILGPVSSGEIIRLKEFGLLNHKALVRKSGNNKKISIQKFYDTYQKSKKDHEAKTQVSSVTNVAAEGSMVSRSSSNISSSDHHLMQSLKKFFIIGVTMGSLGLAVGFYFSKMNSDSKNSAKILSKTETIPLGETIPASVSVNNDSPIIKAKKLVGQFASLNNIQFNNADLQLCQSTCRLYGVDMTGQKIILIFSKNIFYERLQNRTEILEASGRIGVQNGEMVMYLQGVK